MRYSFISLLKYFGIIIIGTTINFIIVKNNPGTNSFSLGILTGGIAVIPIWKSYLDS
jgi:hypothetical protein